MSDTEAPVAAPAEEHVEEQAPAEAPALTLPVGVRIKKPVRPDDTELKTQTDLLHEQIKKNKDRIEAIERLISDKKAGRGEGSKESQAIKSKLAELKTQFQGALTQKQALRQQLDTAKKTRETVRTSLRDLKSNLKFTTVEAIDEQIARLEERVNHSTLTLTEEKRCLEDIKKLKQSRSTVGQYSDKLAQLAQDDSATDDLMGRIKALDEELNKVKAQEEGLREQLAELRAKEAEKSSDIPSLIQEREECREIRKQAYEKIKELRAEHQAKWEEYKEQQQLWNLQWQEDRKRKQETYLAERARRDAERAARMAEMAGEPFNKEITMCEQVVSYLSKYVASEAAAVEEKKADLSAPAGFALMQKRSTDDADAWILGGVGKKGGKAAKGKAAKKEEGSGRKAGGGSGGDEKLVHSLDILEAFAQLKLEVPLTRSKVPPVLEDVRAKKEHFLQRQQEIKENGVPAMQPAEDDGQGEAAATDAAAPAPAPAKAGGSGKGAKNGRLEALKLDEENFPSIGGAAPAPAAAAAAEAEEPEPAADEEEAPVAEAEPEPEAAEASETAEAEAEEAPAAAEAPVATGKGEVTVSLVVSEEDGQSVSVAIQAAN